MPNITISIPAAAVDDVKAAFDMSDKTNAEAAALMKDHLAEYVKLRVRQYKQGLAAAEAIDAVVDIAVT